MAANGFVHYWVQTPAGFISGINVECKRRRIRRKKKISDLAVQICCGRLLVLLASVTAICGGKNRTTLALLILFFVVTLFVDVVRL